MAKVIGRVLTALAVAVVGGLVVGLVIFVLSDHRDQVDKFRDAKNKCDHSLSDTANAIKWAALLADGKRFQTPQDTGDAPMPDIYAGIDRVKNDCVDPPLNWGTPEQSGELQTHKLLISVAWKDRNLHDTNNPDQSVEETDLMEQEKYFEGIDAAVRKSPEPRLRDSLFGVIPW
ncbi:MAG: hypothetical protein VX424_06250 [Actinomycetota bacterium]|nr:hypothetical protein [Actinomycetota bacterium]